jgi:hypothetical protein
VTLAEAFAIQIVAASQERKLRTLNCEEKSSEIFIRDNHVTTADMIGNKIQKDLTFHPISLLIGSFDTCRRSAAPRQPAKRDDVPLRLAWL